MKKIKHIIFACCMFSLALYCMQAPDPKKKISANQPASLTTLATQAIAYHAQNAEHKKLFSLEQFQQLSLERQADVIEAAIEQRIINENKPWICDKAVVYQGHKNSVQSVISVETPDGIRLISWGGDMIIRIVDMDGNHLSDCIGHTGWISGVIAIERQDGIRLVSCSHDMTIRIWDMAGKQLAIC